MASVDAMAQTVRKQPRARIEIAQKMARAATPHGQADDKAGSKLVAVT